MRKNLKGISRNLELEWGSPIKDSQCQLLPQIITTTFDVFQRKGQSRYIFSCNLSKKGKNISQSSG